MAYEEDIEERKRFLLLDDAATSTMQGVQSQIKDAIDASLDKFYAHILQEPELKKLFPDEGTIKKARNGQRDHWLETLFSANPGKAQFDRAEQIGKAHMRVGLTPSWYMSGYCFMLNQFVEIIADQQSDAKVLGRIIQALNKMVFIDMHFVVDAYLDAKDQRICDTLIRATQFTEDVERLNQELASDVQGLRAKAEAGDGAGNIRDGLDELTHHVKKMDERLKQLQFGDKLYSPLGREESFLDRIKAFFR